MVALQDYQSIVDAEWKIIYKKLDQIVATGAQIVFSKLPIGDLATQYFADHNIFCAGRVEESDLQRTSRATGAQIQTTANNISPDVLGKIVNTRYCRNYLLEPMSTCVTTVVAISVFNFSLVFQVGSISNTSNC